MVTKIISNFIFIFFVVFVVVFMGCVEVEDSDTNGFSIYNVVLCSENPKGYMDYEEKPNAIYKAGDVVWIYNNLKGTKYKLNPDGTNEIWLTENITLKAPNGSAIYSKKYTFHKNLSEETDPNNIFLYNHIITKPQFNEGKYIIEMVITDKFSEKTAKILTSFTLIKVENSEIQDLRINNIVFCSENPKSYMDYNEQLDATYQPGDVVWIYMNLEYIEYNPNPDGTNEIWVSGNLTLKAPDGDILLSEEVMNEHQNLPEEIDPNLYFLAIQITTPPQIAEGMYTVEIIAIDKLSNNTATTTTNFRIII